MKRQAREVPPVFSLPAGCADRGHQLNVLGDMVYTSSDEGEDRDVPFAERRVNDLWAEFAGLASQPAGAVPAIWDSHADGLQVAVAQRGGGSGGTAGSLASAAAQSGAGTYISDAPRSPTGVGSARGRQSLGRSGQRPGVSIPSKLPTRPSGAEDKNVQVH